MDANEALRAGGPDELRSAFDMACPNTSAVASAASSDCLHDSQDLQGEPMASVTVPPQWSDIALAERFVGHWTNKLVYVAQWSAWLQWDGARWRKEHTRLAFDLARLMCKEAATEADKSSVQTSIASAQRVAAVERLAQANRRIARSVDDFDTDPWALNTPAGTIDLRTGSLNPHDRRAHHTKLTAASPGGKCPTWASFLARVMNDDAETIAYLQRVIGYLLTGMTTEHALFFLHGTGANGKSTLVNMVHWMLGDYSRVMSMETLTASSYDRHPAELADLRGARAVIANETEEGRRWAEAKIKSLTGGDPITARFMRQDPFTFKPQFKLLISGNHKPALRTVDEAMRRRLHLIPFAVTIPPGERDPSLPDRLRAEASGILQWGVDGCLLWQRHGLCPPASVRAATAGYLEDEDSVSTWLSECCTRSKMAFETRADLFASWSGWAEKSGEHVGTQRRLIEALRSRGFEDARRNGLRGFDGIVVTRQNYTEDRRYGS